DARAYGNGKPPNQVYSAKTIAAVERMAKADRRQATTIEQWDANDQNFNAAGATFDLSSGESYTPRPDDYITKIAGCACAAPDAAHPVWNEFLERILPDPELRSFLQRWF